MKKQMTRISVLTLCAAAILAVPALSRAQDTATNAPAASEQSPPAKKHSAVLPFHGDLASVDTNAMTFVVGTRTFEITSDTRITKGGKPAVLEEGVVGQPVSGAYKKTSEGKLDAVTVHFGKKKKQSAAGN